MKNDIIKVKPLDGFRLKLWFEDGVAGIVDLAGLIRFRGVFEPLLSPEYFRQVRVNKEFGVIEWPNGADIDTPLLYSRVTGIQIPWATEDTTGRAGTTPEEAKRLGIVNKVIDAVARQVISSRTGTIQPTEIVQATIEILPWAKRATVSRRVNRMFGGMSHA